MFLGSVTNEFQANHIDIFPSKSCLQLKIREVSLIIFRYEWTLFNLFFSGSAKNDAGSG